ncbi:MAG: LemA family protein [Candidatus Lindowbacteria bacterium]|nr:LemA family protein [Candidatus Lindowbacteria bacterium]
MKSKSLTISAIIIICFSVIGCGAQAIPQAENEVEAAWAEVQNQYKRRADLIPNLVSVVKGYASHEKETLTAVVEARAKATQTKVNFSDLNDGTMAKYQKAQGGLTSALGKLMVVVEKYPDLKANENFRDLQVQLEGTENRITHARRKYIVAIKEFNNQITVPPSSFTNSLFYHKTKKPQFQVENEDAIKEPPKVSFE